MATKKPSLQDMMKKQAGEAGLDESEEPATRKKHINAKIDVVLQHRMKVFCAQRGITIQDFLSEAIQESMRKAKERERGANA